MPICGIYKITNQTNGKCYIGQSINIKRRWREHKKVILEPESASYNYPLYRAFRKYGLENFSFEILEECPLEELNEKEIKYISEYKSNSSSFGYNQSPGGHQKNPDARKLTEEQVEEICDLLSSTFLTEAEIGKLFNIGQRAISRINTGESYFSSEKDYPIRPKEKSFQIHSLSRSNNYRPRNPIKPKICKQCGAIFFSKEKDQNFCSMNCANLAKRIVERPTREILKQEIREQSFISLSKKYGVSDNAIRRWCKNYKLPFKKKEIKNYSDEEWSNL